MCRLNAAVEFKKMWPSSKVGLARNELTRPVPLGLFKKLQDIKPQGPHSHILLTGGEGGSEGLFWVQNYFWPKEMFWGIWKMQWFFLGHEKKHMDFLGFCTFHQLNINNNISANYLLLVWDFFGYAKTFFWVNFWSWDFFSIKYEPLSTKQHHFCGKMFLKKYQRVPHLIYFITQKQKSQCAIKNRIHCSFWNTLNL